MTGLNPRPTSTNQKMTSFGLDPVPSRERPKSPTALTASPAAIGSLGPTLWIRRPASGDPMMSVPVSGSIRTPVMTGSKPCTSCMKKVMKNMDPTSENMSRVVSTVPTDSETERNRRIGSSGWAARSSQSTNNPSATPAPTKNPIVRALPQP